MLSYINIETWQLDQSSSLLICYSAHPCAKHRPNVEHMINIHEDRRLVIFRTALNIVAYLVDRVAVVMEVFYK